MMKIVALGLLTCFLAPPAAGETLRGIVSDVVGAPIKDALVFVRWDESGSTRGIGNIGIKQDLFLKTDKEGAFTAQLPPGYYDVFVSSPAFSPACRKIRIGKGAAVNFAERLQVSELILEQLAHPMGAAQPKGVAPTLLPYVPVHR
jgi:hypothetical protein